jgi:hypothetical protein
MPPVFGGGLNPGYIQPTPFYNTTNDAQSKFYWGGHGYQYGPTFDAKQYNQVQAPETPWRLQSVAQPLTGEQINDYIQGKAIVSGPVIPATRVEQYVPDTRIPPSYGQVQLTPNVRTTPASSTVSNSSSTIADNPEIVARLGSNWFARQQGAANAGDWDTYFAIQRQVDQILNPVIDRP